MAVKKTNQGTRNNLSTHRIITAGNRCRRSDHIQRLHLESGAAGRSALTFLGASRTEECPLGYALVSQRRAFVLGSCISKLSEAAYIATWNITQAESFKNILVMWSFHLEEWCMEEMGDFGWRSTLQNGRNIYLIASNNIWGNFISKCWEQLILSCHLGEIVIYFFKWKKREGWMY